MFSNTMPKLQIHSPNYRYDAQAEPDAAPGWPGLKCCGLSEAVGEPGPAWEPRFLSLAHLHIYIYIYIYIERERVYLLYVDYSTIDNR